MKIHSVGTELFHADGQTHRQTGMTKLMVAFCNFANNVTSYSHKYQYKTTALTLIDMCDY